MKITPFWKNEYKNFKYIKEYFKDSRQLEKWISLGHNKDCISMEIYQVKNSHNFFKPIKNSFPNLKNIGLCFHKLTPGHYLPLHSDKYEFYSKTNNIKDLNQIKRYIIFLENSYPGHLLIIGTQVISKWKAGDIVGWKGEEPHSALNFGLVDRYTLQVTGINAS